MGEGVLLWCCTWTKSNIPLVSTYTSTNILHTSSVKLPFLGRKHFGAMCLHAFDLHTYRLTGPPHFNKKKTGAYDPPPLSWLTVATRTSTHKMNYLRAFYFFLFSASSLSPVIISFIPFSSITSAFFSVKNVR